MDDMKKQEMARKAFATMCATLDARDWKYSKEEINGNPVIRLGVNGEDIPMDLVIIVDVERTVIRVLSPMPFKFPEDKRVAGAIACCIVSNGFADGSMDYDLSDGSVTYRMTASYRGSEIGQQLCDYLLGCSLAMVDRYNDRLMMLAKGLIDLETFLKDD